VRNGGLVVRRACCQKGEGLRRSSFETASPLQVALYKILFMSRLMYTNMYYTLQTPPLFGQPPHRSSSPTLLRNRLYPPTPLYCNICHMILEMAISCKGLPPGRKALCERPPLDQRRRGLWSEALAAVYIYIYVHTHIYININK